METAGELHTPAAHTNDGFFKAVFSQPEHATAFFKTHLPPAITAKIDWNSLVVILVSHPTLNSKEMPCLSQKN